LARKEGVSMRDYPTDYQDLEEFLYIYGPPGSGKSRVGRQLAERLRCPFHDLDERIVSRAGRSILYIFESEGEMGFRQREKAALEDLMDRAPGVVALGGGTLLDKENRRRVEETGQVLFLCVPWEMLLERVQNEDQRPLLKGDTTTRLLGILETRREHYDSFKLRINSSDGIERIVEEAQMKLGIFQVSGMGKGYRVVVKKSSLDAIGENLKRQGSGGPIGLVTDENVGGYYGERVLASLRKAGYKANSMVIPAGEAYKTIQTATRLWEKFLEIGIERNSTIVSLGGGVVNDTAGFVAATTLRGIDWVTIPTSLLGMVDASLGGKTGIDLAQGKNMVGAFHPPRLVLVDPELLTTLPAIELRSGLAEVVKEGIIGDPTLFEMCSQGLEAVQLNMDEIIRRGMAVKIRVCQEDAYETNKRAVLNLGHTLGHAIEQASSYRIRHGEAVAIGMVRAARLAEDRGLADVGLASKIEGALISLDLPTQVPGDMKREQMIQAIQRDKKRSEGKIRMVLPVRVGEVRWGVEVELEDLIKEA
jgi:shikimate kinase/3-dehydroquinate synthase